MTDKLKIEYIPLEQIKPNEYNPKKITFQDFKKLETSIIEFGIVDPLILNNAKDRENIIIGGHQRYKIYKKLGYKEVPVVFLNIPDFKKEQELCIRLSKNTAEWDWEILKNIDRNLLTESGFDVSELKENFKEDVVMGEEDFTSEILEENNYIVFLFNNKIDFGFIQEKFGLKTVQSLDSKEDYRRKGIGRVVDGNVLLKLLG